MFKRIYNKIKRWVGNLFNIKAFKENKDQSLSLQRIQHNPILTANKAQSWESSAVFNSAAIHLEDKVHFVYRAITVDGQSVFGYAFSENGYLIDSRSRHPIYMRLDLPLSQEKELDLLPFLYQSGNSWCGCEDPRLTHIGDRIFMMYTAFDTRSPPHVELTSISVKDFLTQQWRWSKAIQLSPPYEMHKNWVIFPEKIQGKYAVLHSLSPNILVEYLDTLDDEALQIKSEYQRTQRNISWDNWMRGVGPPPIKTEEGWLVLYHAMDRNDPNKYKLGAMILDSDNPTIIRYRAAHPILEPKEHYELEGCKYGVIYSCGAVVINKTLIVYYGAADTVVCAASIQLDVLLNYLKKSDHTNEHKKKIRKPIFNRFTQ